MIQKFGLENLNELDGGRIVEAWNQAVARCASDCEDRPAVNKARKVILELELTPVIDVDTSSLDSVSGQFKVVDTAPKRETKPYSLGFRKERGKARLFFNDMSEDDINQQTLDQQ